jgi:hypothetical protein
MYSQEQGATSIQCNPVHLCRRFSVCLIYLHVDDEKEDFCQEAIIRSLLDLFCGVVRMNFDDVVDYWLLCFCSGNETQ